MVSVHLMNVLQVEHISKYADMRASATCQTLCAKNALVKVGERDLCNRRFPLSAIRYAFPPQRLSNNLMTEAYSCCAHQFGNEGATWTLRRTNYLDKWSLCGKSSYPRYEPLDPFEVFVRGRGYEVDGDHLFNSTER